jgi:hypothetical protein
MTDKIVEKLRSEALAAARATPVPKNPKAFIMADKLMALSDDFISGAKTPSPFTRAIARSIVERADRINRSK